MPVTPTYPGVYIEEVPSGVRTIVGVATSTTAFIGRAPRGPVNDPRVIGGFADYERLFGGLWEPSTMSYSVQQFFLNGGGEAVIVRIENGAAAATLTLPAGADTLTLEAASPGAWGNSLEATIDLDVARPGEAGLFNLNVFELAAPGSDEIVAAEAHLNVSTDPAARRYVPKVLEQNSMLVRVQGPAPADAPDASLANPDGTLIATAANGDGDDGDPLEQDQYLGSEADKEGIFALEKTDLFNLLVVPPFEPETDVTLDLWAAALEYCKRRRALLVVDAPSDWGSFADAEAGLQDLADVGLLDKDAALYFPRFRAANPLREGQLVELAPSGAVAGIFARTDVLRGVWKAPAGLDANVRGVRELAVKLTDKEQGRLNPIGINCMRGFPIVGHVVWGARTLRGADKLGSEWKYVPVRRLALYLEESLYRGTQWVVFEPNDEPLWAQIRLNVGAFMQNLFRQGAFQGTSPREAYFVKCDKETTTQNDIDRGIVNIIVGFAPLKPAEFVIIKIQQIAGQVQA